MEAENKDVPAFELRGGAMQNRLKDVFGCLDELEVKHKAFEDTRANEDADTDRRLIQDGPSSEEMETINSSKFKHPGAFTGRDFQNPRKGGRHGNTRIGHNVEFKKPMPPPPGGNRGPSFRGRFGRGRATPDYKVHPDRWTEYSLEDVDLSDSSNKKAALSFLQERRNQEEADVKKNAVDLETNACSKGHIVFKKPSKTKSGDSRQDKKDKSSALSVNMEDDSEETSETGDVDIEMEEEVDKSKVMASSELDVDKCSLKRKLDELEDSEAGSSGSSEKPVEFRSRKSAKRQIRNRRDNDGDSD